MGKAELSAKIADLEEQSEKQKSELIGGFKYIKWYFEPKNIAKRAAGNLMSKVRSIFQSKKKRIQAPPLSGSLPSSNLNI